MSSEDDQIRGGQGEGFAAALLDHYSILYPYAADTGQVDAGLNGDKLVHLQQIAAVLAETGALVDIDAQAVAQAVTKAALIAVLIDVVSGDGIDVLAALACHDRRLRALLGLQDGIVHPAHFVAGLAKGDGAGHIGAVAAALGAKVHGDHIALAQLAGAGDRMAEAAVFARGDDGVEGVEL